MIGKLLALVADSRRADGPYLSRAERLEIISLIATAEMGECSAWIIPMLEHGNPDENPRMEKIKC